MTTTNARRTFLFASVCMFAATGAMAADFTVAAGATDTTQKTVAGTDTGVVQAGGTLTVAANPAINWNGASTALTITNSGTIRSTAAGGRAIGTSGAIGGSRSVQLTNGVGAVIESADDAFRINSLATSGTIRVDNAGTIRTTGGGQALDFDAANAGGATIIINNAVTGQLRSIGQDAIRPGRAATVTNAGLISVDEGMGYDNRDGIDWQQNAGVVLNQATGVITGMRHGITSDINVTVTNEAGGTITGRNGSGIGSDGDGTVVNRGRITGRVSGLNPLGNGDGDGVDIDFNANITNSGIIEGLGAQGVDSGGNPNSAQAIAIGRGVIVNQAGGQITSTGSAILVDDGGVGGAYGTVTVTNAGTITGATGGLIVVGTFADTVTNSGTISTTSGKAIDLGGGDDVLNLQTGSVITGVVDGGAGADTANLTGGGTFAGGVNFETLNVQSGTWTLTGAQSYGISRISSGATAHVNGAVSGPLNVAQGGRLRGPGSVGALTVAGVIAPGASIGTMTVNGNLGMVSTATYEAEVNAAGQSDRIVVNGSASLAGTLSVLAEAGTYNQFTSYTVLTATGGVSGGFTTVTSNLAFLTPQVSYAPNAVTLNLLRNDVQFASIGQTPNQIAVGGAITAQTITSPLYLGVVPLSADGARAAFDILSGDIHGSVRGALFEGGRAPAEVAINRLSGAETGVWAKIGGSESRTEAEGGRGRTGESRAVFMGGADASAGGWRFGVMGNLVDSEVSMRARLSNAEIQGGSGSVYAGGSLGPVQVHVGASLGRYDVETARFVGVAGFSERLTAEYDADTSEVFAEAAMSFGSDTFSVQPFAGLAWHKLETSAFSEGAAGAALSGGADETDFTSFTAGLRMKGNVAWLGAAVTPRLSLAFRHAPDLDEESAATVAFSAGGPSFAVVGGWRDATAGLLEAGADFALGTRAKAWMAYSGQFSRRATDHAVQVGVAASF